jgi:2-oxoisovalerate dehydrogenase E2 component (dihydrolipoyl transacylase)
VAEEDPICAMLTDKAAVELTAPVGGRVVSLAGAAGDTVTVGAPLIVFETAAAGAAAPQTEADSSPESSAEPLPQSSAEPAPQVPAEPSEATTKSADRATGKVLTSPSIRARARAAGVDLSRIAGSGPRGRILKSDLEAYLAGGAAAAEQAPAAQRRDGIREIKVIGLRRKIAGHMAEAAREIPHFSYVEEIDVTALESLREHLNARRPAGAEPLTPLPFLGLALVRALRRFPQCNAHYDAGRNVLLQHEAVHLGIATQTPDGLKVPVVRHAEARSLQDLAAEIRRVSAAARDNTATREQLSGSTITITSLGKLGGIASTPIINLPEVGIVGVNRIVERPVFVEGRVEARLLMNLSSSFDHRFVDGYDGAAFIQAVRELLEQPALIFIAE